MKKLESYNDHGLFINEHENYISIEFESNDDYHQNKLIYLDKNVKPKVIYSGRTWECHNILVIGDLVLECISSEVSDLIAIILRDYFYGD